MFTDPIAQVVFTSPSSGKVWNLTAPDWPFLTGVTLAYEMARKATLQINLDAPYEDAIGKLLKRGTPLTLGTNVKARMGYASKPDWFTPWFGGFLNAGGDGLTLDANGLTGQISVQVVPSQAEYTMSQERVVLDANPIVMLTQCIQAMGLLPAITPGVEANAVAVLDPKDKKNKPWSPEAYANLTAWEAIKQACAFMNLKYWIGPDVSDPTSKANTVYIATEADISQGLVMRQAAAGSKADPGTAPRPTFRVRGVVDLNTSTFPCLSWSPEGGGASATWLAAGDDQTGKGVLLAYVDPDSGEVVEIPATPEKQQVATAGPQAAVQQDLVSTDPDGSEAKGDEKKQDGKPAVVISAPMPAGDAGAKRAQSEADRRQAAGNPAQQGTITSLGLPWLVPPMMINLVGAGDIYDGPYMIQKATHTWSGGNYEMSLSVLRKGTGGVDPEGEKKQTPVGAVSEG
jgi:hypothetical protein